MSATFDLPTPEGIVLHFELARPSERLMAYIIDSLLNLLAIVGLFVGVAVVSTAMRNEHLFAIALLCFFVLRQGYFLMFETGMHGTTPGKRMQGLRVIDASGGVLQIDSLIARNLMRDLETSVPLALLFAPEQLLGRAPGWVSFPAAGWILIVLLLPFVSKHRTRVGDLIGGTVVIRVPKAQLQRDQAQMLTIREEEFAFDRQHLSVYGELELETLATILRQVEGQQYDPQGLEVVAETIARKIGYQVPQRADVIAFLRAFYRAQRAALEKTLVMGKRKKDKLD